MKTKGKLKTFVYKIIGVITECVPFQIQVLDRVPFQINVLKDRQIFELIGKHLFLT